MNPNDINSMQLNSSVDVKKATKILSAAQKYLQEQKVLTEEELKLLEDIHEAPEVQYLLQIVNPQHVEQYTGLKEKRGGYFSALVSLLKERYSDDFIVKELLNYTFEALAVLRHIGFVCDSIQEQPDDVRLIVYEAYISQILKGNVFGHFNITNMPDTILNRYMPTCAFQNADTEINS